MVAIEAAISYFCATVRWAPFCAAVCLVFAGLLTYLAVNEGIRYSARVAGFGGPRGWPVVGNLWHIRTNAAEQYRRWARTHGPVYQIMLGNVPVIVVNSAKAANAVFLSNSHALSSRPEFYTFHKVCGGEWVGNIEIRRLMDGGEGRSSRTRQGRPLARHHTAIH